MAKYMWHCTSRPTVASYFQMCKLLYVELLPHAQVTCSNIKSNVKRVSFVIQDTLAHSSTMLHAIWLLNEWMRI